MLCDDGVPNEGQANDAEVDKGHAMSVSQQPCFEFGACPRATTPVLQDSDGIGCHGYSKA